MSASRFIRSLAVPFLLAASALTGCAETDDDGAEGEDVATEDSAVRTRALGDVAAIRTRRTSGSATKVGETGAKAKLTLMLKASGVTAQSLPPGSTRCLEKNSPVELEYLDRTGAVLGTVKFACDPLPDGKTPGTLRVGAKQYIVMADVGSIGSIDDEAKVVGDALWGVTRVEGRIWATERRTSNGTRVRAALGAVGLEQGTKPGPVVLPACLPDNTIRFYRGATEVGSLQVICKLDRDARATATISTTGASGFGGGVIEVNAGGLRYALSFPADVPGPSL